MPLNASPPTVDVAAFDAKLASGRASSRVDFGLWGGVIPGNVAHLRPLAERGVIGFKAFVSSSEVADFPASDTATLLASMEVIAGTGLTLAVR
jgi:allantoinase